MNTKYKLVVLVVIVFVLIKAFNYYVVYLDQSPSSGQLQGYSEKSNFVFNIIKVSVYYEALCLDSKFFVLNQLVPMYEKLGRYVTLDLIPYGKAQTIEQNGKYFFHCQHDELECVANKIHACVISYVKEPAVQLKYIACMIKNNANPDDAGDRCARQWSLDYAPIAKCAGSTMGDELLAEYGKRTHSLTPPLHFVPTIEINDSQDSNSIPQSAILKDLFKAVCDVSKASNQPFPPCQY